MTLPCASSRQPFTRHLVTGASHCIARHCRANFAIRSIVKILRLNIVTAEPSVVDRATTSVRQQWESFMNPRKVFLLITSLLAGSACTVSDATEPEPAPEPAITSTAQALTLPQRTTLCQA